VQIMPEADMPTIVTKSEGKLGTAAVAATGDTKTLPFEAILWMPAPVADGKLPPLITVPHGGPHGSFSTDYHFGHVFFACAGFAVLAINFRGSTAYGETFLRALPGRCGTLDVRDCVHATQFVTSHLKLADHSQLGVFGGSHGGFLTTHLIGQYPTLFKAAATRNPVCNIPLMTGITDIPDWCYCESGLPYDTARIPSSNDYAKMFSMSPIAHVQNVRTPLLLLLGAADLRVPNSQALDYIRILRARGVTTRTILYPDSQHALNDKISMEADVWLNAFLWLSQRFSDTTNVSLLA